MLSNQEKPIAAIGATGQQGGAVVRALQALGRFRVRALSRRSPQSRSKPPETLKPAFEGAHGVFIVTNFSQEGTDEAIDRIVKEAGFQNRMFVIAPFFYQNLVGAAPRKSR